MFVVCDTRSNMRNIRSQINYCLGKTPWLFQIHIWLISKQVSDMKVIEFGLRLSKKGANLKHRGM